MYFKHSDKLIGACLGWLFGNPILIQSNSRKKFKLQTAVTLKRYLLILATSFFYVWINQTQLRLMLRKIYPLLQHTPKQSFTVAAVSNDTLFTESVDAFGKAMKLQIISRTNWLPGLFTRFKPLYRSHQLDYSPQLLLLFLTQESVYLWKELVIWSTVFVNVIQIIPIF